jgi:hypothetical protein
MPDDRAVHHHAVERNAFFQCQLPQLRDQRLYGLRRQRVVAYPQRGPAVGLPAEAQQALRPGLIRRGERTQRPRQPLDRPCGRAGHAVHAFHDDRPWSRHGEMSVARRRHRNQPSRGVGHFGGRRLSDRRRNHGVALVQYARTWDVGNEGKVAVGETVLLEHPRASHCPSTGRRHAVRGQQRQDAASPPQVRRFREYFIHVLALVGVLERLTLYLWLRSHDIASGPGS